MVDKVLSGQWDSGAPDCGRDNGEQGFAKATGQWRTWFGQGDGGEDGTGGVGGDMGRSSHGDRREVGEGREEGGI